MHDLARIWNGNVNKQMKGMADRPTDRPTDRRTDRAVELIVKRFAVIDVEFVCLVF